MPKHPYIIKSATKKIDSSKGIFLKVISGEFTEILRLISKETIIITQSRNTLSCKSICNNSKRLMLKQFLISILLSATRNHHKDRRFLRETSRKSQSTIKFDIAILEFRLLGSIRKRRYWSLRTVESGFCQIQRKRHPHLLEHALNLLAFESSFIASANSRNGDLHISILATCPVSLYTNRPLTRRIHRATFRREVEHNRKFRSWQIQFTFPSALLCISHKRAEN